MRPSVMVAADGRESGSALPHVRRESGDSDMVRSNVGARGGKRAVGLLCVLAVSGLGGRSVTAQESGLNGSSYGAYVKVGLFGGEPNQVGAAPVVVLPPGGGSVSDSLPQLIAQFGPATIFGGQFEGSGRNPSGELTVSTEGETGPNAFVTSSANVVNVGPGPLIADELSSTCTADENGVSGSTTVVNGTVETSYDVGTQEAATTEDVSRQPAPNTAVEGTIDHVGDRFRIVFNEQIVDGDTITVRAAHMYLLGDIAVGDMIIGQSVCGLSPDDGSTAPPTTEPDPNAPTTTAPATTAAPDDTELSTEPTGTQSDTSAAPILIGALAVLGIGVAALVAFKRRGGGAP